MLEGARQDARFALRLLARSPVFTATAALSLAIGIGANTTIFSLANALLFRTLPGLTDPGQLVDIGRTVRGDGFDTVSYPNYLDVRDRATMFAGIYAYELEPRAMSLGGRGDAERIYGALVTANYFTVLGTQPHLGRLLQPDDDIEGRQQVAVISRELWERRFGSDPSAVGQTIVINGKPVALVGVAPRGFQGTTVLKSDVWLPITNVGTVRRDAELLKSRRSVWLFMGGRLKESTSIAQAQSELQAIAAALEREHPESNKDRGLVVKPSAVVPGQTGIVAGFLGVLMAIVGLVLLIACVNIAGMLLARAAGRRREIAVRLAIGAGRWRLARQLLTETVVLFAIGCAAGIVLSTWLTSALLQVIPALPVPVSIDVETDLRVLAFAVAVSFAAALLSGIAPALHLSHANLVPALKTEGLEGGPSRLRLRSAFVVAQVTMSLLLVVVAGLLLRSLQEAGAVQPGFSEERVDVATLDLSLAGYQEATGHAFVRDLLARIRALPGVESATASRDLPLDGGRFGLGSVRVPGVELPRGQQTYSADWNIVEPGFFATLKLPLLRGRDFTDADTRTSQPVAIVNEVMARELWPGHDGLGKTLVMQGRSGTQELTVVGVASNARLMSLGEEAEPYIYVPLSQYYLGGTSLLVRRSGDASAIPQIRALLRSMDPNLPLTEAMPLAEVTAIGLVPQRLAASVAGSLGLVGLLLAAIGIYGVTAYAAQHRTREIGIRIALGADTRQVLRLILRQGLVLAGIGIAIGVAAAALGSQLLQSLLFGVGTLDPLTFGGTCLLFAGITLVASYIPARRATRVDPISALRYE